mmetsp:Transcript_27877/g.91238  ORF Transcript_27877/g.91238 Transcript_27877/m.91238 type:complete len:256 (+) Transcript_27877:225-992(+)
MHQRSVRHGNQISRGALAIACAHDKPGRGGVFLRSNLRRVQALQRDAAEGEGGFGGDESVVSSRARSHCQPAPVVEPHARARPRMALRGRARAAHLQGLEKAHQEIHIHDSRRGSIAWGAIQHVEGHRHPWAGAGRRLHRGRHAQAQARVDRYGRRRKADRLEGRPDLCILSWNHPKQRRRVLQPRDPHRDGGTPPQRTRRHLHGANLLVRPRVLRARNLEKHVLPLPSRMVAMDAPSVPGYARRMHPRVAGERD